jgi:lipooligosaccharide transport system permease protein
MTAISIPRPRGLLSFRPEISLRALAVWQRNRDVYYNVWRAEVIWPIVEPLVTLLALGVGLSDFVQLEGQSEEEYVEFIGPALIAVFSMWAATAEASWGSFFRMDQQGTFSAILATPVSVDEIATGEILWAATRSMISVFYVMVMVLLFGGIESPLALLIFPLAVLPGIMFGSIALAYSAIARSVSSLNYFFATYVTPQFWLSGVFFPLSEMPDWVEVVAWFTPAYHVVRIYRGLSGNNLEAGHLLDVAWIVVVTVVAYCLALILLRRRMVK